MRNLYRLNMFNFSVKNNNINNTYSNKLNNNVVASALLLINGKHNNTIISRMHIMSFI